MMSFSNSYQNQNSMKYKPEIPYFTTFCTELGSIVVMQGRIPFGSKGFDINLMVGSVISEQMKRSGDIGFHFNPRFDEQTVIRNNRRNNVWGPEERDPKAMPFVCGQHFQLMILVTEQSYKVAVNGKHFIDFEHRIPVSCVGVLNINGNIEMDSIELRRENRYRPQTLPVQSVNCFTPVYNPPLPYHQIFPEGLREGIMVYVSGRLNSSPDRFAIDFCSGTEPFNDIAFHFNVRMRESVIVRNTKQSDNWGPEERQIPNFPFAAGVNFDMIFRVESNRFMVAVNGQHLIQYLHRIPIQSVNAFSISGDVIIASIRFSQS